SDFMEQIEEVDRVAPASEERSESRRPERPAEVEPRTATSVEEPIEEVAVAQTSEVQPASTPPMQQERGDRKEERSSRAPERPEHSGEAGAPNPRDRHRRFSRRGRRHRGRHRDLPESKYARAGTTSVPVEEASQAAPPVEPTPERILLPGESLAKYREPASHAEHAASPAETPVWAPSEPEESPSDAAGVTFLEQSAPAHAPATRTVDVAGSKLESAKDD